MRWWLGIVVGVMTAQLFGYATTVYAHRGLAHRAVVIHPVAAWGFRFVLWITTGLKPRGWAAVHRRHHAATDTPDDPHSPKIYGFWRVQLGGHALYSKALHDGVTVDRYARDLPPDKWDRWLFDRSFVGIGIGAAALWLVLGWQTAALAIVVHFAFVILLTNTINAIGHTVGRQPYPNSGTNGRLLSFFTAGEALHNNHHAAPTSARFAHRGGEVDPGWWIVRGLSLLGQADVRHAEAKVRAATSG